MKQSIEKSNIEDEESPDIETILLQLRKEDNRYVARAALCGLSWSVAVLFLFDWIAFSSISSNSKPIPLVMSLLSLITGTLLLPSTKSGALDRLKKCCDRRAVGPLLDSLSVSYRSKVRTIQELLTGLLPQLLHEDRLLLDRSHLGILYTALDIEEADDNLEYRLAVVSALGRIGNEETANRLRRLVNRGVITKAQYQLQAAAIKSLAALEQRLIREQVSNTLLRASSCSLSAEHLLRPLTFIPELKEETLLIPINSSPE